jgi:hypothetical protein
MSLAKKPHSTAIVADDKLYNVQRSNSERCHLKGHIAPQPTLLWFSKILTYFPFLVLLLYRNRPSAERLLHQDKVRTLLLVSDVNTSDLIIF